MAKKETTNAENYPFSPTELTVIGTELFDKVDDIADREEAPVRGMINVLATVLKDARKKEMLDVDGRRDAAQLDAFAQFSRKQLDSSERQKYLNDLYGEILAGRSITDENKDTVRRQVIDKVMKLYIKLRDQFDANVTRKTFRGEAVGSGEYVPRADIEAGLTIEDPALWGVQMEVRDGLASDQARVQRERGSGSIDPRRRHGDGQRRTGTNG